MRHGENFGHIVQGFYRAYFYSKMQDIVLGMEGNQYICTAFLFVLVFIKCGQLECQKKVEENFLRGWKLKNCLKVAGRHVKQSLMGPMKFKHKINIDTTMQDHERLYHCL